MFWFWRILVLKVEEEMILVVLVDLFGFIISRGGLLNENYEEDELYFY